MSWEQFESVMSDIITSSLPESQSRSIMTNIKSKKSEFVKFLKVQKRTKKDPNAPEKWNTSYIIFCNEQREKLKRENSSLSATEMTKHFGQLWKSLSEGDKKRYEEISQKDKERYQREMKEYAPEDKHEKSNKKVTPKRPLSSYMLFCQENRTQIKAQNPGFSGAQITSLLAKQWKELSVEEKSRYTQSTKTETKEDLTAEQPNEQKPADVKASFFENMTRQVKKINPKWSNQKVQAEVNRLWLEKDTQEEELSDIEDE